LIKEVVVNFGSQVNNLPRETWIRLGQLALAQTMNYLKLVDQRLIETIGIPINIDTQIMGILTQVDFEVITLVMGMSTYATIVGRPWGRKMKENISLEKNRIKLKGDGRKIIIPLDQKVGKPWTESWDEDQESRCLYKIKKEQRDYVEPTAQEEILREYPMLVGDNSDSTLYKWQIKNYKAHEKKNWSIEIIPKNPKTF
jgi:hypothetical protein